MESHSHNAEPADRYHLSFGKRGELYPTLFLYETRQRAGPVQGQYGEWPIDGAALPKYLPMGLQQPEVFSATQRDRRTALYPTNAA